MYFLLVTTSGLHSFQYSSKLQWTFSCLYLVNIQCKHRTWAPLCPISGGNPAALLLPCSRGRGESRRLVCLFCGPGDSEGGRCVLGVIAHVISHLASSFVHITRTSEREHVPSEGFMELSSYPCLHISTPPASRSFVKHIDPKCSTNVKPLSFCSSPSFPCAVYPPIVCCSDWTCYHMVTHAVYSYHNSWVVLARGHAASFASWFAFLLSSMTHLFYFDANHLHVIQSML